MQVRLMRFLSVVMMCGLLLPGMVTAQSDDAARDVVLEAVEDVTALEGYHLKIKSNYLSQITQANGFVTNTYTIQSIEGDVAQNGDRQFTWHTQSGDSFESAVASEVLVIEQIVSDGETYVNFHTEDTSYADMLDIQPGWWEYDHLVESVDSAITTGVIQQYRQSDILLIRNDTILSVTELEPQVDNGVSLRVFDVELDAVKLLLEQAATSEEQEQMLAQSQDLLAASDIRMTYRVWVGAEDGLVYRGKGETRMYLPYLSAGSDSDPDFDLESSNTVEFTISRHGDPVAITPPETVNE